MNCPVCNITLKQISCENQEIDLCQKCVGVWFDKGELLKVVNSLLDKNKVDPQTVMEAHSKEIIDSKSIKQLTRNCPRCQVEMQMYNFFYDSNVFLDKCSRCDGIWADKGEMQAVSKYLKGNSKMDSYANSLIKECGKHQKSENKIFKIIAVLIALVYLIIIFHGDCSRFNPFFRLELLFPFALGCIFFGKEFGSKTGVRFRLSPAPIITKPTPGIIITFMGWIMLLLPIIYKILLGIGLFE
ncbi:MAG: zf-TFIIB domain-containing protein [Alphaproteobacteria bacterium]